MTYVCSIGNATIHWPGSLEIYFTINQNHFKSPPKVFQIFQLHNYLNVLSITTSKEVFLLFLLQISMTQKRLCYHLEYLCGTVINFLIILSSYCCTLLDYTSPSQYPGTLIYLLGHYVFVWFSYRMVHNSECFIFISGSSTLCWLLWFPSQVCKRHHNHWDSPSSPRYRIWFLYMFGMFHLKDHSP